MQVRLARTIHIFRLYIFIRCIYSVYGREITKYMVLYGVYIQFWPTLRTRNTRIAYLLVARLWGNFFQPLCPKRHRSSSSRLLSGILIIYINNNIHYCLHGNLGLVKPSTAWDHDKRVHARTLCSHCCMAPYLFRAIPAPWPLWEADANHDKRVPACTLAHTACRHGAILTTTSCNPCTVNFVGGRCWSW
jgi:hypothetical protein